MKCIICNAEIENALKLSKHLNYKHKCTSQEYYDKYVNATSKICKMCGKPTRFVSLTEGYKTYCSTKCAMADPEVRELVSQRTKAATEDIKKRNLERYGVEWTSQLESQKAKIKKTFLERYGVEHPMQLPEIRNKRNKSNLEHLGVEFPMQSKEIQAKIKNTNLKKYNVECPLQQKEIREKALKNAWSAEAREKRISTTMKNYGCSYNLQRAEVIAKSKNNSTKKKRALSTRDTVLEKYKDKIGAFENLFIKLANKINLNYECQYYSDKYPYLCDFYLPDSDCYVEINGFWTHGDHWYSDKDSSVIEEWKEKDNEFYRNAIYTWTKLDVDKRNIAKKNNLNYVVLWSIADIDRWFSLGCPTGKDWDHEYSWCKP